ncbi:MAG: UDP-N-acetylglucosamine 2-epimerase (non-hydrolyzing), partial [Nitrospinae bacterium]|nr:UDP-N-acetylglucosamine 2-epimerase (non-hydrolyzing) [Nitrospinota bacterium]
GTEILLQELEEQMLPDGGHFELSPMYHSIILEDILDLINLSNCYGENEVLQKIKLKEYRCKMRGWLSRLIHPDGNIALFNDSAFNIAPTFNELEDYSGRLGLKGLNETLPEVEYLRDSGYARMTTGNIFLLFDVGKVGPDYLPAHAHADTLSFELSYSGKRVFVDSGTSLYEVSQKRHQQRSTCSHNSVCIDGENSSEVWGSFRVARRAYPFNLNIEDNESFCKVTCSHDGFKRLKGNPVHTRSIELNKKKCTIMDSVTGEDSHQIDTFYFFHSDITLIEEGKGMISLLRNNLKFATMQIIGDTVRYCLNKSTYYPEFNYSEENTMLQLSAKILLPYHYGVEITFFFFLLMKIIIVAGARPNFMKIAPLIDQLKLKKEMLPDLEYLLVHTGQHYDDKMSHIFFTELGIPKPDIDLEVGSGSHAEQTGKIMIAFEKLLIDEKPDCIVVVGDVNSTLACAVTAKKLRIKVAHVEAGLRSRDWDMPEEVNRVVTDVLSDFLFTTDKRASENLKHEGIASEKVFFTGNVMIDTLLKLQSKAVEKKMWEAYNLKEFQYAVMTLHRPSNVDNQEHLLSIIHAIEEVVKDISLIFALHPRTKKMLETFSLMDRLTSMKNLYITEPLSYLEMLSLNSKAAFILTDSGGLQEEAVMLGVPCVTLRENTERPVTIDIGINRLLDQ